MVLHCESKVDLPNYRAPYPRVSVRSNVVHSPWARPTDWRALPEVLSTDQKLVGLFAVWPGTGNVVAMKCRGAYNVDWGDGSSENVADNTIVNHTYDYADADLAGTDCTRGYKQAIIVVTSQGGNNLTSIVLEVVPTVPAGVNSNTSVGWLDITISSSLLTTLTLFGAGLVRAYLLEQVTIVNHGLTLTSGNSLFANLMGLRSIPTFNTSALTSMSGMFSTCSNLQVAPLMDTALVISMSSMFYQCPNLQTVPLYNTAKVTDMSSMFAYDYGLLTVPLFNTIKVATMSSMFNSCFALQSVPLFNTSVVTDMSSMFSSCYSLQTVPLFNTIKVTTMLYMFQNCYSLQTVPLFNLAAVTTMVSMFQSCSALQSVPLFNPPLATDMSYMFSSCYNLQTVPSFNTIKVTTMSYMFASCNVLQTVPLFDMQAVTDTSSMFSSCKSLCTVPALNPAIATTMASMFISCSSLSYVPALSASAVTATAGLATIFGTCKALSNAVLTGAKYAVSIASCRFSTTEIETLMDALGAGVSSPVFTCSNNFGAPAEISKANSGTTSGSTAVTLADTSTLAVGMEIRGTGISDAVAVTTQDTGDTVTRVAHGIPDGTRISFATIVTTTGIVVNTPYYVVNGAADTFQVSDTLGGSAKALTTDGSGTIVYGTTISAIDPNVSFTLSIPASATASVTTYSAVLKRSKARLHGFTVTG